MWQILGLNDYDNRGDACIGVSSFEQQTRFWPANCSKRCTYPIFQDSRVERTSFNLVGAIFVRLVFNIIMARKSDVLNEGRAMNQVSTLGSRVKLCQLERVVALPMHSCLSPSSVNFSGVELFHSKWGDALPSQCSGLPLHAEVRSCSA